MEEVRSAVARLEDDCSNKHDVHYILWMDKRTLFNIQMSMGGSWNEEMESECISLHSFILDMYDRGVNQSVTDL